MLYFSPMTMRKILLVFLIIPCMFLLHSCMKDVSNIGSEITWKPEFALPIGYVDFTLGDALGETSGLNPLLESQLDTIAGFIYDNDLFEIPEKIKHREIIAFSFPFDSNEELKLTYFMLRTSITNSIPARIDCQIYFIDGTAVIDSFYQDGPLAIFPAETDDKGEPIKDYETGIIDSEFDENELEKLENTTSIVISTQVYLNNIDDVITKYHPEQSFWMQLATEFHLELNTE